MNIENKKTSPAQFVRQVRQELSKVTNKKVSITFTPHLIPMFRGILSTMYLETKRNLSPIKVYKYLIRHIQIQLLKTHQVVL